MRVLYIGFKNTSDRLYENEATVFGIPAERQCSAHSLSDCFRPNRKQKKKTTNAHLVQRVKKSSILSDSTKYHLNEFGSAKRHRAIRSTKDSHDTYTCHTHTCPHTHSHTALIHVTKHSADIPIHVNAFIVLYTLQMTHGWECANSVSASLHGYTNIRVHRYLQLHSNNTKQYQFYFPR